MICLDSLWQQLSDSVGHQMPSEMTPCPRHGGHSHGDWSAPTPAARAHLIMLHPKAVNASWAEFRGSPLLSPGHSVHVRLGKGLWKLESAASDGVGYSKLKVAGDGELAAGELHCTGAQRRA